jgi:hypothetical protein
VNYESPPVVNWPPRPLWAFGFRLLTLPQPLRLFLYRQSNACVC